MSEYNVIPERLSKRPVFQGMPVPFTALITNGVPDFRTTDHANWLICATTRVCGLCGEPLSLSHPVCFIGGEKSATSGFFYDPPMHEECAEYAFKVCPFLACLKGYSKAAQEIGRSNHQD